MPARGKWLAPDSMFPAGVDGLRASRVRVDTGVTLRVVESGPASGEPVLLLHGWGASAYSFRHLLRDLAAARYRGIAVDFRGHGLSDKPTGRGQYTREAVTSDVRALVDRLGVHRFSVVGHSMGGAVATRLGLELPARVSRLVVINPAGFTRIRLLALAGLLQPALIDRLAPRVPPPRWLIRQILRWTYGDPSLTTERDVDEYWAPSQFPDYLRAANALLHEFEWKPTPAEELARLTVPTLVLLGTRDRLVRGVGRAVGGLSCARIVELRGAGHLACEERAEEASRAIVDFLRRGLAS